MDIKFIETLFLNVLVIVGFYRLCMYKRNTVKGEGGVVTETIHEKQPLWFVRYYGSRFIPEVLMKPICMCIVCMSSVHSLYVFWYNYELSVSNLGLYGLYVLALTGLVHIGVSNNIIKQWLS